MDTRDVNHRRFDLFTGPAIRHMVEAIAQRTPTDLVDDTVATMRLTFPPEKRGQFADVDRVAHKAKQHVLCGRCFRPITVDDARSNECHNCGSEIFKERSGTKW